MIGDLGVKCVEVDRGSGGGMRPLKDPRGRGQTKHLIAARPGWARRRGPWVGMQRGAIFGVVWSPVETGGTIVEVKRQQQDRGG